MCGPSQARPSTGNLIAAMFPSMTSKSTAPYSLFFREVDASTKAIFRIEDTNTFDLFRGCKGVDLRIEKFGDLSAVSNPDTHPPLYTFKLLPQTMETSGVDFEVELPERLDLGVSERGIVGRQVTVLVGGDLGRGIVGYD